MTDAEKMRGPWIRTYTKRIVNPLDLSTEDICIEDIAHHLATLNRFVGALGHPVSIAQHSICVARLMQGWMGPKFALYGLLHDASEAYLGDVSKWLKGHAAMWFYRDAEERAQFVIEKRFGLNSFDMSVVAGGTLERADRLMVRAEGEMGFDIPELIPNNERYATVTAEEWSDIQMLIGSHLLRELDWRTTEQLFLAEFREASRAQ